MADETEKSGPEPNLELPSLLGFGRRKKRKGDAAQDEQGTEQIDADEPVAEATPPEDTDPVAADPVAEPRGGLAPSTDKAKRLPPVPPPSARTNAPAQQIPVPPPPLPPPDEPEKVEAPPVMEEPARAQDPPDLEPWQRDVPAVGDTETERMEITEPAAGGPDTSARHEHQPVAQDPPEQTTVLPIGEPDPRGAEPTAPPVDENHETPVDVRVDESLGWPAEEPADDSDAQRPARGATALTLPTVNPRIATVVTGGLVGLVGVLLAYFASRGCETIRGVGSCGGMGLLALLMIVAIQVVLGAVILKAWQISDPTSTSFLGVGLVAVFVLLFLLSSLESVWMLLVIPVLSALTFLLSWWVTTAFVEVPGEDARR